jgi:hypothetical protein
MTPYQNGSGAASALAPEAPLFADNDPGVFGEALAAAALAATKHPLTGASLTMQLAASW